MENGVGCVEDVVDDPNIAHVGHEDVSCPDKKNASPQDELTSTGAYSSPQETLASSVATGSEESSSDTAVSTDQQPDGLGEFFYNCVSVDCFS